MILCLPTCFSLWVPTVFSKIAILARPNLIISWVFRILYPCTLDTLHAVYTREYRYILQRLPCAIAYTYLISFESIVASKASMVVVQVQSEQIGKQTFLIIYKIQFL